jgi:hypothetical protein
MLVGFCVATRPSWSRGPSMAEMCIKSVNIRDNAMKLFSYNNKWAKNYNHISRGIVESNAT